MAWWAAYSSLCFSNIGLGEGGGVVLVGVDAAAVVVVVVAFVRACVRACVRTWGAWSSGHRGTGGAPRGNLRSECWSCRRLRIESEWVRWRVVVGEVMEEVMEEVMGEVMGEVKGELNVELNGKLK